MAAAQLESSLSLFFGGLGSKLPKNSNRYKVSCYKTTGFYFMSVGIKIGYEVGVGLPCNVVN